MRCLIDNLVVWSQAALISETAIGIQGMDSVCDKQHVMFLDNRLLLIYSIVSYANRFQNVHLESWVQQLTNFHKVTCACNY